MTRNRYDRDDERDSSGASRERGGGAQEGGGQRLERSGYGRGSGPLNREYGYDEPGGPRRRAGGPGGGQYYSRDDYARGGYEDRGENRYYEGRYSTSEGGPGRNRREGFREDDERARFEDARDYARGRTGQRGRGASRSHVRCRDIMTRDVTVATRDTSLQQVAAMMRDEDTGVIPVVDLIDAPTTGGDGGNGRSDAKTSGNGKLAGLITDRDIALRAVADGKDIRSTRAEEVMTTDIHTAQPNDRVIDVIRKMGDKQVRRIPVVDNDGTLRGIISMADVALETEEDRELAEALEEISSGSSFWSKIFG